VIAAVHRLGTLGARGLRGVRRWHWPGALGLLLALAAALLYGVEMPRVEQAIEVTQQAVAARRVSLATPSAQDVVPFDPATLFRDGFPPLPSQHQRVDALLTLAQQEGLNAARIELRHSDEPRLGLRRTAVALPARGSYDAVRGFVERALQGDSALALDSVRLQRVDGSDAMLQIELVFSLWARDDAAAGTAGAAGKAQRR
jgi:hypothetical protein